MRGPGAIPGRFARRPAAARRLAPVAGEPSLMTGRYGIQGRYAEPQSARGLIRWDGEMPFGEAATTPLIPFTFD